MAGWSPNDDRAAFSISVNENSNEPFANKCATGIGDEDLHVIRFAEVILNRAEAYARLGQLSRGGRRGQQDSGARGPPAVGAWRDCREQQAAVLDAVWQERRLELAFEGFRWTDLVRTGRAVAALGLSSRPHQVLYPIPQAELDVAPNITQNAGY